MTNSIYKSLSKTNIIPLLLLILASCNANQSLSLQTFDEENKKYYSSYLEGNINEADQANLNFLNVIERYKKMGLGGINYDVIEGSTCIRAYLVKREKGQVDEAGKYLEKALSLHLTSLEVHENRKLNPSEIESEQLKLIQFIEEMDKKNSAKWLESKYK